MRPRELAHLLGFGRRYFHAFWARELDIFEAPVKLQDATGALFVHIPKTAGVSVCRSVFETEQLFGHAPASGWKKRDRSRFDTLFKFSLMREPKDRFFSAFYYLRNGALTQKDNDFSARHLAAFETPADLLAAMARGPLLRAQIMSWVHFTPQSWYLTDPDGQIIVDYIGCVETFDSSMRDITARLGKPYTPAHTNSSKRPQAVALPPKAQTMLERLYHEDFLLYRERFKAAA